MTRTRFQQARRRHFLKARVARLHTEILFAFSVRAQQFLVEHKLRVARKKVLSTICAHVHRRAVISAPLHMRVGQAQGTETRMDNSQSRFSPLPVAHCASGAHQT
jgi:hypothetical protein